MNYEHIILSNFPSSIASLSAMNEKGEDIREKEFRYTGFIRPEDYSVLLDNSIEKLFISLLLYKEIYLSDRDFLKIIKTIGVKNSIILLERKIIKIIPRYQDPHVIVHKSTNPLITKTWHEIEPLMYLGGLRELDKNYKNFSVNESYKAKIMQYFENAHVSLNDYDDAIFFKNIEILKQEEQFNFSNLDYKSTFRALRLYEVIESYLLQDKHNLSNSLVDDYGQNYLESKFFINDNNLGEGTRKLNLFVDISTQKRIPNFYYMYKKGSLEMSQFLDLRETFNSKLFRSWFTDPTNTKEDIYYELMKNHSINIKFNLIKWLVPTIIGVLNTPLGVAASSVENFFISKLLQGWNPNLFLDDILSKKLNTLENKFELENQREKMLQRYKNIDRNSPCPCQSGKKFKKCHGVSI